MVKGKQTKSILLTELTPEHELPVADDRIEIGQPVRWNRAAPGRVWVASAMIGNFFGIALEAADKDQRIKIAPIQFGTVAGPTTVRVDFATMGKPDLTRVIVLVDPDEGRQWVLGSVLLSQYDPAVHELPTAIQPIRASNNVSFTARNQVMLHDPPYNEMSGIALTNAAEGEGIQVLVQGSVKDYASIHIAVFAKRGTDDKPQT